METSFSDELNRATNFTEKVRDLLNSNKRCGFKDGAHYCYCAYVLRISKHSGFPWVMLANKRLFFARLESRTKQVLLVSKTWG